MRHTLHSHIIYLENLIQTLSDRLTASHLSIEDREGIESQMYHAQLALVHYRKAYAHELTVSGPDAPDSPKNKSEGESGDPAGSKPGRKKQDGLTAFVARKRRKASIRLRRSFSIDRGSARAHLP